MKKALSLAQPGPHVATIFSESTKEMMVTMLFEIPDVNMLTCKFVAAV
jgi:hypothetical protein